MPDLRLVGGGDARGWSGPARPPSRAAPPRAVPRNPGTTGPNGSAEPLSARNCSAVRMISSEFASASLGGVAPGGDAVPAQDAADGLRVRRLDRGDIQAELETGPPPRHPHHPVTERLAGQLLPVDRGGQRDPGIRVQMIHVGGVDQRRASPCRSTGRRRPCRAGSSRTPPPSRPPGRPRGTHRPARAAGPAAAPPGSSRSACRGHRRIP